MDAGKLEWSACTSCGAALAANGASLTCGGCGVALRCVRGVVRAAGREYPYYGEVSRERIAAWRDVIAAADPEEDPPEIFAADPWRRRYVFDRGRADPLRLLGDVAGLRVLDVGCGWGLYSEQVVRAGGEVVALDTTAERAEFTAARVGRLGDVPVAVVHGALEDAPLRAGAFDVALLVGVLEWTPEAERDTSPEEVQRRLLHRIAELLAPGGRVLLCIENRYGGHYFAGRREEHTERRFVSLLPRRLAGAYLERVQEGRGARARTHSPRRLATMLRRAGLQPRSPAYALPAYTLPRYIVGNERGRAHGFRFLLGDVIDLGGRHPLLRPAQRALELPAVHRRVMHLFAPSLVVVADRGASPPPPEKETFMFTGPRPFGEFTVVAELDGGGTPSAFRKIARYASAEPKLAGEADALARARAAFGPDIAVPHGALESRAVLRMTPLDGTRLSALTGDREALRAAVVAMSSRLGAVAARTARELPVDSVLLDPVLPDDVQAEMRDEGRRLGLDTLRAGLSHADLHPANVLVTADGEVGLVDWTLASAPCPAPFDLLYVLVELTRLLEPGTGGVTIAPALEPALDAFVRAGGAPRREVDAYRGLFMLTRTARDAIPYAERAGAHHPAEAL